MVIITLDNANEVKMVGLTNAFLYDVIIAFSKIEERRQSNGGFWLYTLLFDFCSFFFFRRCSMLMLVYGCISHHASILC